MARRKREPARVGEFDGERTVAWCYARFTRPLATDPPEVGAAIVKRIAHERNRLDEIGRPLADRLAALEAFAAGLGHPGHLRRAMESAPPKGLNPR